MRSFRYRRSLEQFVFGDTVLVAETADDPRGAAASHGESGGDDERGLLHSLVSLSEHEIRDVPVQNVTVGRVRRPEGRPQARGYAC